MAPLLRATTINHARTLVGRATSGAQVARLFADASGERIPSAARLAESVHANAFHVLAIERNGVEQTRCLIYASKLVASSFNSDRIGSVRVRWIESHRIDRVQVPSHCPSLAPSRCYAPSKLTTETSLQQRQYVSAAVAIISRPSRS